MHATHEHNQPDRHLVLQAHSHTSQPADLDKHPGPVFGFDRHGLVAAWNRAMARLTRRPAEAVMGTSLPALLRALPDFKLHVTGSLEEAHEPRVITFLDSAGEEHRIRCAFRVERNGEGLLTRVLAMGLPSPAPTGKGQPVSAEQTQELISTILHSINNGLTVINGNLNLLGMSSLISSQPDLRQLAQDAGAASEQQTRHLSALQQVALAAWGPQGSCDARETLATSADVLSRSLPEGIKLTTSGAAGCRIGVSSGELHALLQHLVQNAAEASDGKGPIHLDCQPVTDLPGQVEVTVCDAGRGIDPQSIDCLTHPSFTTKRGVGGAGIGLALVDLLARSAGGALAFESAPGEGTLVRLLLPGTGENEQN